MSVWKSVDSKWIIDLVMVWGMMHVVEELSSHKYELLDDKGIINNIQYQVDQIKYGVVTEHWNGWRVFLNVGIKCPFSVTSNGRKD